MSEDTAEEKLMQWKRRRRNTLIGYIIVGIMDGINYNFMITTLYLYLRDVVGTQRPELFYGIIVSIYSISSIPSGVISGRWVDKTRKVKSYTIFTIIIQIIGCLFYVIHFNVAYPLIGRLIAGIGDPFVSVASGEIIRIYDREEGTRALWWIGSVYSFGAIIGPVFVFSFKNVDCYIGTIHVTQLNAIALFVAGMLLVTLVLVLILINDCSAEFDLKQYLKERMIDGSEENGEPWDVCVEEELRLFNSSNPTVPTRDIIKGLLSHANTVLMLVSSFVFMYIAYSCDVLITPITIQILNWSLTAVTIISLIFGVVYLLIVMIMGNVCTTDKAVYIMSIVSIVAYIGVLIMMVAMKVLERNRSRDILMMSMFIVCLVFAWSMELVLIPCTLAKMVPSHCQSFTGALRNGIARLGAICVAISSLMLPYLLWWSSCLIVVVLCLLLGFLTRRRYLCKIKEINFHNTTADGLHSQNVLLFDHLEEQTP